MVSLRLIGAMIRVAKLAHAHDFIENLPDGYQTAVNERA